MNTKKQNGFTILFAVLVSSILLAVGASIFNITVKNLLFSGTGRESLKAFAAADSGLECAQYWDANGDALFGSYDTLPTTSDTAENAKCVGVVLLGEGEMETKKVGENIITTFSINKENVCVDVTVTKSDGGLLSDGSRGTKTTIESRGHNTCIKGDRQLERAIKITFSDV